ncbi:uncharacterized protein HMPREF1541_07898 [Cyphellophora europaea CBS 101466]|uniref:Uncharacterized protein n=1 Tax=Cyphellophora europaea (strain CBS 101466) TaxID=1220924 RepID=W2RKD0_CYPE1|nr:uncharacterized protein HMPREF1541_07898 [Cyphellophora europaea CBS 101466]ETN36911.1 hypothetical protein HMPREF1541_07898 [Cyphellophora europaea CBS 101466]
MPYHDLNLLHSPDSRTLNHALSFATELGYTTIAIATIINGKLPSTPPVLDIKPLQDAHPSLTLLTRLTLPISDPSQNHRLSQFSSAFSLLALRPLNEKSLQLACTSLDCDLITLDLSARLPFILKFKTVSAALQRGVRFEICYAPGVTGSSDAKRNLIAGATSLIRATRGRGIVLSSEARNALGLRGPHDVMNICQVWGLEQARGKEAVVEEVGKVVRLAALRRQSYRGVITVVDGGGGKLTPNEAAKAGKQAVRVDNGRAVEGSGNGVKRKASSLTQTTSLAATPATTESSGPSSARDTASEEIGTEKPPSKRELKRRAKKARLEGGMSQSQSPSQAQAQAQAQAQQPKMDGKFPVRHETLPVANAGASSRKK